MYYALIVFFRMHIVMKDYSVSQEIKLLKKLNTEQQKIINESGFNLREAYQLFFDWSIEKIKRIEK